MVPSVTVILLTTPPSANTGTVWPSNWSKPKNVVNGWSIDQVPALAILGRPSGSLAISCVMALVMVAVMDMGLIQLVALAIPPPTLTTHPTMFDPNTGESAVMVTLPVAALTVRFAEG